MCVSAWTNEYVKENCELRAKTFRIDCVLCQLDFVELSAHVVFTSSSRWKHWILNSIFHKKQTHTQRYQIDKVAIFIFTYQPRKESEQGWKTFEGEIQARHQQIVKVFIKLNFGEENEIFLNEIW